MKEDWTIVCCSCRSVKNKEEGTWGPDKIQMVDQHLSNGNFSSGFCHDCQDKIREKRNDKNINTL